LVEIPDAIFAAKQVRALIMKARAGFAARFATPNYQRYELSKATNYH
jgi:hypothetical protein